MRAAWLVSVMALAWLASDVCAESRASSTRQGRSKSSAEENKKPIWTVEVQGWGPEAHQMALKNAQAELDAFLASQKPPFLWKPLPDYIEKNLQKDSKPALKRTLAGEEVVGETLFIGVSTHDYRDMTNRDRVTRSDQRMIFLGKVLAGLVAMFGAFAGYFRLEEATKGFYTAWLRLGAIGLVAMVGAGLYWFR
jgi:hypothetical protein